VLDGWPAVAVELLLAAGAELLDGAAGWLDTTSLLGT
jgi:hypothetical protein